MIETEITIEPDTALIGANEGRLVLTFLLSQILNESNTANSLIPLQIFFSVYNL